MNPVIQWATPIIVGILTFFGGRLFERRRIANQNRRELLEPIEAWIEKASRLIGIVRDDISAVSLGLPQPVGYSMQERIETSREMGENKEKVLGILNSTALQTRGTKKLSDSLRDSVINLSNIIERGYLQSNSRMLEAMNAGEDPSDDIMSLVQTTLLANVIIQEAHGTIAELRTRFS